MKLEDLIEAEKPVTTLEDARREAKAIEQAVGKIEAELEEAWGTNECRYKSYQANASTKTFEWITQQSTDEAGLYAAKAIAKFLRKQLGIKGWTVKVTIRDNYRGDTTQWQGKAKS